MDLVVQGVLGAVSCLIWLKSSFCAQNVPVVEIGSVGRGIDVDVTAPGITINEVWQFSFMVHLSWYNTTAEKVIPPFFFLASINIAVCGAGSYWCFFFLGLAFGSDCIIASVHAR